MGRKRVELQKFWERCGDEEGLRRWLTTYVRLKVPGKGVCEGHGSPFDYLAAAYLEPARDLVVWAPRGGGKTRMAALATLLDLLHKPGCSVRILGGSLEQSLRMWEYLLPDLEEMVPDDIVGRLGGKRVRLVNGSAAGVLTQSERSVRGVRVQKLRCDEVEMFDDRVWEAAQLVTRSARDGTGEVIGGAVEALSTCHRPGGLMERVVEEAEATGVRVIKWCILDVLEQCDESRACESCALLEDCGRRAKLRTDGGGFVSVDDAIAMKRRVSKETWEAEMLCRRPSAKGCVFQTFEEGVHVRESLPAVSAEAVETGRKAGLYLGMDFGFHNPFVCLWVWRDRFGRSFVIDEYVKSEVDVAGHIQAIRQRARGPVRCVCCDPAGSGPNEQTGISTVNLLRAAGFKVVHRGSRIADGLEMIRAGLRTGTGEASLFIHPRCVELVKAMRSYRYGEGRSETPEKDGADHLVDALRYYFVARDAGDARAGRY
jgi:hypothetical protein